MKKKLNLIIFIFVSMFAFSMSAMAEHSIPADGEWHEIKPGGGQGTYSDCYQVSGNFSANYDSSAKKCYVKSNVISQSGFRATIHLTSAGGAYGGRLNSNVEIQFTSAGGTGSSNVTEKVATGEWPADGQWHSLQGQVTGAITDVTIVSGAARVYKNNGAYGVAATSSGDVKLKVIHGSVGSVWTTYLTINFGEAAGGNSVDSSSTSSGDKTDDSTIANALQICDANESPKIVASFRLVGIFVTIIKIIVPIIIIVMGMFDMSKAVLEGKDDSIKKQAISLLRRAIACVLIFFVPTIMRNLFHFIDGWDDVENEYSTCIDCILGDSSCPEVGFGVGDINNSDLGGSSNSNDSSNYSGGSTTHTSSSGNTHGGSSGTFGDDSSTHTSSSGNTHSDSSGSFGDGSSTHTSSSGQTSGGSSGKIDNDLHGHF